MTDALYLVDASTFIHRSFHAIRNMSTKDGRPTNAIFGLTMVLQKLLKERDPKLLVVAFDSKGPSFRKNLYPEYKANRPPMPEELVVQQEPIRRLVQALGLPTVEVPGLEADDIIATLTARGREQGREVIIVSSDKDFYQLLADGVSMYDPNPKRETTVDVASLNEKIGLSPAGFLEAQALMGDSTDNIPGVPGVGEKTAVKLIQAHGTLENLYASLDQVAQAGLRKKLAENKEKAFLSRDLARLKQDAELPSGPEDLAVREPDSTALRDIYADLEFSRFASDLPPERSLDYDDYHLIGSAAELQRVAAALAGVSRLSVDLETTSLDPISAEIVGISLCGQAHRSYYVAVGHKQEDADQVPWEVARPILQPLLEEPGPAKVGQNLKYDYTILRRHGIRLGPIAGDSMIASYLLDPGAGGHGLNHLSRTILNHDPIKYEEVTAGKGGLFDRLTPQEALTYAAEDADVAFQLEEILRARLTEAGLDRLYDTVEVPLIAILAEMEMVGVALDLDLLNNLSKELEIRMESIVSRIHALAGREFNINSPKQLGEVLFDELKLPQAKKTRKTGSYSTDVEVLTELAAKHELPAEVLAYRTLAKLRSTYVEALSQLVRPDTGRVHTSFNQAVTATGRLSSSDPNLQNIPIRTDEGRRIREAFVAPPGSVLLSADYSQIELRVLAHVSGDQGLIDAFRQGEDIHTRTASEVFNILPGMVDADRRREAKAINFGIVYGLGAYGLSRQLGIERKKAQEYIDLYFARLPGVKRFIDETLAQTRETGFSTTLLGRRRALPDINAKNGQTRAMAERMAINTPIQGTAADLIKLAMIAAHRRIAEAGLASRMLLQVHDELVFEIPEPEVEAMKKLVREAMEGVYDLAAPLVVDMNVGRNWAEAH